MRRDAPFPTDASIPRLCAEQAGQACPNATNVSATRYHPNGCSIAWDHNQPSVMWDVHQRNLSTGETQVMGPYGNKNALAVCLNSLVSYEFRVRAVNSLGKGAWSAGAICHRP